MYLRRYKLKIIALQPSVVLDRGFFQWMTILSKCRLPDNFDVRVSFVFTDAMCNNMDSIAGKHLQRLWIMCYFILY